MGIRVIRGELHLISEHFFLLSMLVGELVVLRHAGAFVIS